VIGGGKDGIVGIALTEPGILAAHAVLGFEMADDGLDGGPAQFALDLRFHPSPLPRDEDTELVIGRCTVAAIARVGENALEVLPTTASISGITVARVWPL
jgi:hypothetical protein